MPKFDILPNEESEIWAPFTDSGASGEHVQPSRIRAVSLQIAKLAEISGDLLVFFYHLVPTEQFSKQMELRKLSEIHIRLEAWKKNLPKELDPKEGQLPQALLMQYVNYKATTNDDADCSVVCSINFSLYTSTDLS